MPRNTCFLPLVILGMSLHAAAAVPAPNCDLAKPPAQAGIDRHMGVLLKVYPRTPDIGPAYAGCQTLWVQSGDGWEILTVAHYAAGRVTRVANPAVPGDPVEQCLVEAGVVLRGDPALCAQLDDMRFESLPAACLAPPAARAGTEAVRCVRE